MYKQIKGRSDSSKSANNNNKNNSKAITTTTATACVCECVNVRMCVFGVCLKPEKWKLVSKRSKLSMG